MTTEEKAHKYSLLCHLFECFAHGLNFDPDAPLLMTSKQSRAAALRALEIMDIELPDL
jgi:hypothetical protein